MEKPDFENEEIGGWVDLYAMLHSLHDRNTQPQVVCDAIVQRFEHVWMTHVVPLVEKHKDLIILLTERTKQLNESITLKRQAESENKLLREEIDRLKTELNSANSALDNISERGNA